MIVDDKFSDKRSLHKERLGFDKPTASKKRLNSTEDFDLEHHCFVCNRKLLASSLKKRYSEDIHVAQTIALRENLLEVALKSCTLALILLLLRVTSTTKNVITTSGILVLM